MDRIQIVLVCLSILLLSLCQNIDCATTKGAKLKFADFSEKCKIPKLGELVRTHEECDSSKGLVCQKYGAGEMCGCPIQSVLSWDEVSKECRRKVGTECSPAEPEALKEIPFNFKCHQRAFCRAVDFTSEETGGKEYRNLCDCREGYTSHPDRGLGSCVSVDGSTDNGTTSSLSILTFLLLALSHYILIN